MSPGVVKQSSTSSCCSALSWTSDASQHSHGHGGGGGPHGGHLPATPPHSGSIPYLPPPSYEKALQESQGAVLMRGQAFQEDDDDYVQQREDREDGYETLAMQPRQLQHQSSSSYPDVDVVDVPVKGPIILHKSSKALYRAVAAQWGITCKMNDHCRCLDCQSRYFDCDFDLNEEGKTDGGLGATSPIFLQEVMHGSACHIL